MRARRKGRSKTSVLTRAFSAACRRVLLQPDQRQPAGTEAISNQVVWATVDCVDANLSQVIITCLRFSEHQLFHTIKYYLVSLYDR